MRTILIGRRFMAKTYEWKNSYGETCKMTDNKNLWVDEVLVINGKHILVFLTKNGTETEIEVTELKIYE